MCPRHVPALLKLVEICVDGGLEAAMYQAQAQLADAYLSSSQAAEARFIAEDLVAREPWEAAHIERFRRALVDAPRARAGHRHRGAVERPDAVHGDGSFRIRCARSRLNLRPRSRRGAPNRHPNPSRRRRRRSPSIRGARGAATGEVQTARPGRDRSDECARGLAGRRGGAAAAAAGPQTSTREPRRGLQGFPQGRVAQGRCRSVGAAHAARARRTLEMGMLEEAAAALKTAAQFPAPAVRGRCPAARLYQGPGRHPARHRMVRTRRGSAGADSSKRAARCCTISA